MSHCGTHTRRYVAACQPGPRINCNARHECHTDIKAILASNKMFLFSVVLAAHKIQQLLYEHTLSFEMTNSFKLSVLEMMYSRIIVYKKYSLVLYLRLELLLL